MASKFFVFSDIHGCFNELKSLMQKIEDLIDDDSQLIFLGDYIDRGPNSKKVLDYLLKLREKYPSTIFLYGNHEKMFLEFIIEPKMSNPFLYNGGHETLKDFKKDMRWDIDDKYIEFINSMKLYYETEDYFFVHAGVPNKDFDELTFEDEEDLLWIRDSFLESERIWDKMIIHGHTPVQEVEFKDNRINIDTGCVFNGQLTCLVLPEQQVISQKNLGQSAQ